MDCTASTCSGRSDGITSFVLAQSRISSGECAARMTVLLQLHGQREILAPELLSVIVVGGADSGYPAAGGRLGGHFGSCRTTDDGRRRSGDPRGNAPDRGARA